jgi:glycosyltransferase involved in cell wall biosynthesis
MKISIITIAYNSEKTINNTLDSVLSQNYDNFEYIIIDGNSKDSTLYILESYRDLFSKKFINYIIVSENDNGIYDAMNKGIRMSSGDIIGILNSDDFYSNNSVLSEVVQQFNNTKTECVFADVRFVKNNDLGKTVRYYSSAKFNPKNFKYGFMPAHPTFFTFKKNYDKFGFYKIDYRIAADYELLVRFLYTHKLSYSYIPKALTIMRVGGVSTRSFISNYILNKEIVRCCNENGIKTNMCILFFKYFIKIFELINTRNDK